MRGSPRVFARPGYPSGEGDFRRPRAAGDPRPPLRTPRRLQAGSDEATRVTLASEICASSSFFHGQYDRVDFADAPARVDAVDVEEEHAVDPDQMRAVEHSVREVGQRAGDQPPGRPEHRLNHHRRPDEVRAIWPQTWPAKIAETRMASVATTEETSFRSRVLTCPSIRIDAPKRWARRWSRISSRSAQR